MRGDWQVRNYKNRFARKTTSNRRKKGHEIIENCSNIDHLCIDNNYNTPETYNYGTSSITYLPLHLYAYEKNDLIENVDNVKVTEDSTVDQKNVLFEITSMEKNEVLTCRSANNLPMTERPLLQTSNYFKRNLYLCYSIRKYSQGSKVFTPTATEVEEEIAKKPQYLPPLGPPPVMQPPPPRQPPLPSCPRKKGKKKKFAVLDERCLLINRQTKSFVGCDQQEDQSSKHVPDKVYTGHILQPPY